MSSAGAVAIQSARLSQMGVNRQILKEGSSVLVRVINNRGGGKYEGSVAGVRVQLTSSKPLKAGDSFVATVNIRNGSIVVTPKETTNIQGFGEIALQLNEVSQSQLLSLLEALGLPADKLSSTILQSFKQMGLKLDSALANKIRGFALRFAGKEKSAAEILSILAQKGLEPDEEEIKELLSFLDEAETSDAGNGIERESNFNNGRESVKKLFNTINSKEGAWYLFPFELVQMDYYKTNTSDERIIVGNGCIRLLYDSDKNLKLLNLDCNYSLRKFLFSLIYEGKKIKNIHFNVSEAENQVTPEESYNQINKIKKLFMAAGINPGEIIWVERDVLEGNASGLENFVTFGGEV